MLTYEVYVSNYIGVNINNSSDEIFGLSKLHLAEKIINHVRLEVSTSLKARDTPAGK